MVDDGKQGPNLASGSVILVALVATGAFIFHKDAPLMGSRPAITDAGIHEQAEGQTINARLWQDPFAAVNKEIEKLGKSDHGQQCGNNPSGDRTCLSPLITADSDVKQTLVIGVTMSGAPYSEDAEQRRRTRYAVLAGLERAGFVPRDERHIGYFWLPQEYQTYAPLRPELSRLLQIYPKWSDANRAAPTAVELKPLPFPLSPLADPHARNHNELAATGSTVQSPLFALSTLLSLYESEPGRSEIAAINSEPGHSVPFEWFEALPGNQSSVPKNILVLWLKEENLKNYPLYQFSKLKQFLHLQEAQKLKIVGPFSSGILHEMVKETCPFVKTDKRNECGPASPQVDLSSLSDVAFYAYGASAPDRQLLDKWYDSYRTVEGYFAKLDIPLQRTIATDDKLADGIKAELELRNVKVGPHFEKGDGDLALISEWDTFYGQTLPKAVEQAFGKCDGDPGCWIHKLTYMRGLDGLLPTTEVADDRKQDKQEAQGEKKGGAAAFFKTPTDPNNLDRPVGQGQFDYLRRMSKDLHKADDELRKKGRRIKAIGVLGSDVFDKLLILRALQPEFPEAIFFTTDFDEAFTIESELPYTRNLIISSSFGPKLNDDIQGEIPSFRSSYQTAAFLATLSAIGDPDNNWKTPEGFSDYIHGQLSAPQIFEISRSGNAWAISGDGVPASASPMHHDGKEKACLKDSGSCNPLLLVAQASVIEHRSATNGEAQKDTKESPPCTEGIASNCGNIQPVNDPLFPTFDDTGRELLTGGLASVAFFGLVLLCLGKVPKDVRVEVSLFVAGLGLSALACAFWQWFAQFVTGYGKGEPIAMLEGVSVWPTVLLRIFGIILSIYFIWRAQLSLRKNLADIAGHMGLNSKPKSASNQRTFWKRIKEVFDFSLGSNQTVKQIDPKNSESPPKIEVKPIWDAYVAQEQFRSRRFWRAFSYAAVMFMIFWFVLQPLFGRPITPVRGPFAANAYFLITVADVLLMLFLTFFVFDATCFCLLFVNKLRGAKTKWPKETIKAFNERMRLPPEVVHDWVDLEFVAKRTRCIGWLIYCPFILIALLIVSRSSVFANYPPSPTILVAQGISLSVVFGCAIMLWWAATAARDAAKHNLTDKIIWVKGPRAVVCSISSVTPQTGSHASKLVTGQPPVQPGHAEQRNDTVADQPKDSEDNPRYAEQLETLLNRVEQLRDGAFGPFTQQPLVRAVLLPLGSFGWTALIENGMLPGL